MNIEIGNVLTCNRCDKKFSAQREHIASEYEKRTGIARIIQGLEHCEFCGMYDSHWIYQKDNEGR